LNHFTTLLETSKFKRFNLKQRLSKFSVVRKLLFVLQIGIYDNDMIPQLVQTLGMYTRHHFAADPCIKPLVSYLAANLHEGKLNTFHISPLTRVESERPLSGSATPRSVVTRVDNSVRRERAEQVYEILVQNLTNPVLLNKFTVALPLSRVLLLLLGEHPSPIVASQTLILLGLILNSSPSFNRKFELVSGWTALKAILPSAWDPSVHVAAFDLLLGRVFIPGKQLPSGMVKVVCPYILPAILSSLSYGLERVTAGAFLPPVTPNSGVTSHGTVFSHEGYSVISAMEVLVEELIDLFSSTSTFRQLFKSKHTSTILINGCQSFVARIYEFPHTRAKAERLLDKVVTLASLLAADPAVEGQQKEQVSYSIRFKVYSLIPCI
jgi:hypothetical protein